MLNISPLDQLAKPHTLRLCITGEIQNDGDTPRQESANVGSERASQSRIALYESRYISDLARKQGIQKLVLHEEDRIFSFGQIPCESGLTCRHLATQENQLCRGVHAFP
jgi:imidazole glycerol phosphate synthase subunit HisF